ncbi:MAG: hypothetical protein ACXVAW_08165 [Vulcanimicrobiaceae bacterium]
MLSIRRVVQRAGVTAFALALASCGGHSGQTQAVVPDVSAPAPNSDPAGARTPTPVPRATATPTAPPTVPRSGPPRSRFMPSSWGRIGLLQIFDATNQHRISGAQARAAGRQYDAVWGASPATAREWRANAPTLRVAYYMPFQTDASSTAWSAIGHTLTWWQAKRPDWVLYGCTSSGEPINAPVFIRGLEDNVPLDIHNPAVVAYQVRLAANFAIANGYNAVGFDEVTFWNATLTSTGSFDCAVRENGRLVRRYTGPNDPQWAADTVAWVKTAHRILTTDPSIAPHHLALIVNHPAGDITNPNEQALLQNVDADLDETGFSDYGRYANYPRLFKATVDWMIYAQRHGVATLINNEFSDRSLTPREVEYAIATHLMGNEQASALFTGPAQSYGAQQYHTEYGTRFGPPCGEYYGGTGASSELYYRRFENAIAIVNASSHSQLAQLPAGKTYVDLERRPVSNPLRVGPGDAYVLLTSDGCQL